jgi:hypothetical protein
MALGLTPPLTEMSTRNVSWRPVRRADNLTTFMCRLSWNLGASASWNPQGLSRPVMGLLYFYISYRFYVRIIRKDLVMLKVRDCGQIWSNVPTFAWGNWGRPRNFYREDSQSMGHDLYPDRQVQFRWLHRNRRRKDASVLLSPAAGNVFLHLNFLWSCQLGRGEQWKISVPPLVKGSNTIPLPFPAFGSLLFHHTMCHQPVRQATEPVTKQPS